tara:strand:- start:22 stop:285 length:264 start_codon:yes stop_codon:yes gene_type:complete
MTTEAKVGPAPAMTPPEGGQFVTPEQMAEHKEATEFAKHAQQSELKMRKASIILQSLSVGGDVVEPLFDKKTRKELMDKVSALLKSL